MKNIIKKLFFKVFGTYIQTYILQELAREYGSIIANVSQWYPRNEDHGDDPIIIPVIDLEISSGPGSLYIKPPRTFSGGK